MKKQKFGDIEVNDSREAYFKPENLVEINWAALGAVSVEDAEKFAQDLVEAIEYAKSLK